MSGDQGEGPELREAETASPLPPGFRPRGCTFNPEDWAILARRWFPVARVVDVGRPPLAVRLLDLPLVVYRTGETLNVGRDLCPHRGVPRAWAGSRATS